MQILRTALCALGLVFYLPKLSAQLPDIKKDSLIHSVMWHPVDRVDAAPVVGLGQEGALQLRFDDFSQSVLPLRYVWIHCDRNWAPSPIIASEYLT